MQPLPQQRVSRVSVPLVGLIGIASLVAALDIREEAPDFLLPSTTGEPISLHQFRGKSLVLLEFFVAASSLTGT